jgi:hypothetical protein
MTAGLLVSRQSKNELFAQSKAAASDQNITTYVTYRNMYNRLIRAAKKQYFHAKINTNGGNSKAMWDTLKEAMNKPCNTNSITSILKNGNSINDPKQMADEFNRFFTHIGQSISDAVVQTDAQAEDFVHYDHQFPDLNLGNVTPQYVEKILKSFTAKSSVDIDGISTKLLKMIGAEISVPLSHIFNRSITSGVFPDRLKKCRVVPIHKTGDNKNVDNYRPISMLSSI